MNTYKSDEFTRVPSVGTAKQSKWDDKEIIKQQNNPYIYIIMLAYENDFLSTMCRRD